MRKQAVTDGTSGTSTTSYQDQPCAGVIDTHRMTSERRWRWAVPRRPILRSPRRGRRSTRARGRGWAFAERGAPIHRFADLLVENIDELAMADIRAWASRSATPDAVLGMEGPAPLLDPPRQDGESS